MRMSGLCSLTRSLKCFHYNKPSCLFIDPLNLHTLTLFSPSPPYFLFVLSAPIPLIVLPLFSISSRLLLALSFSLLSFHVHVVTHSESVGPTITTFGGSENTYLLMGGNHHCYSNRAPKQRSFGRHAASLCPPKYVFLSWCACQHVGRFLIG